MSHVIEVRHKGSAARPWRMNVTRAPNGRIGVAAGVRDPKAFRALGAALAQKLEG